MASTQPMTQQNTTQQQNGAQQNATRTAANDAQERERRSERTESAIRPPVDVFETADGITLQADMPGVSRDRLNLRVDGNTLLLEGNVEFDMAEQMQALYADLRSTLYRCSFVLSNELDTARIEANLKDGVMSVRIPKRAELQPRRIEVRTT
jgi:HSP20 family protein